MRNQHLRREDLEKKRVAVIIVNCNGADYLPDCLSSVFEQTYRNYEVILVDNNSEDKSLEFVRRRFPQVEIVANSENLGFATGNNIGIRKALEQGAEYVVLLNYDTHVAHNWLDALVNTAQKDPRIGMCQSKIFLHDKPDIINTAGNMIHYLGFGYCGHYMERDHGQFQEEAEIAYASGASVLIKREIFDAIGVFDDDLFMYHEDLDLGWLARLQGYRIVLSPSSRVYHKYCFEKSKSKYYYMERNRLLILLKNYEFRSLVLIAPAFFIMETGILLYSLVGGWFGLKLRGYRYLLTNSRKILQKRKKVQMNRKVRDAEVTQYFTGEINFFDISSPLLNRIVNPFFSFGFRLIKPMMSW